jgi:hypothetical protein
VFDLTACWFLSDNGQLFKGSGYGFSGSGLVFLQDLNSFGFSGLWFFSRILVNSFWFFDSGLLKQRCTNNGAFKSGFRSM